MTEVEHYKDLREKYHNNTATPAELVEFYEMATSGKYDAFEKEELREIWKSLRPANDEELAAGARLEGRIFKQSAKVRSINGPRVLLIAATIIPLIIAGLWIMRTSVYTTPIVEGRQTYMVTGPKYIVLPDSSTVELKEGSSLIYEESFGKRQRNVRLYGTAFFDVQHNPDRPFRVYSGHVVTTVMGTAFNVTEAEVKGTVEVTVVRGRVSVGDSSRVFNVVEPNQKITILTSTMNYSTLDVQPKEELHWKENNLVFRQIKMEEIARTLEKKFNVQISFTNPELKKCVVTTGFVRNEDLRQILDILSTLWNATPVIEGNRVIIEGGKACNE